MTAEARVVLAAVVAVAGIAGMMVALGDAHGWAGPVADLQVRSAAALPRPGLGGQLAQARAVVEKWARARGAPRLANARRHKVEALVSQRRQRAAARSEKAASAVLMHGARSPAARKGQRLAALRPVHPFGGQFAREEAAPEHRRSAGQELAHLDKLNAEIFGAAPKAVRWKRTTAAQELASFRSVTDRTAGRWSNAHKILAKDTGAKELALDSAVNDVVFAPRHKKVRAAFTGDSAAMELKHLRRVSVRVVPRENMKSVFRHARTSTTRHPALAGRGPRQHEERKV